MKNRANCMQRADRLCLFFERAFFIDVMRLLFIQSPFIPHEESMPRGMSASQSARGIVWRMIMVPVLHLGHFVMSLPVSSRISSFGVFFSNLSGSADRSKNVRMADMFSDFLENRNTGFSYKRLEEHATENV
jgi:hypothetical protein